MSLFFGRMPLDLRVLSAYFESDLEAASVLNRIVGLLDFEARQFDA